MTTNPDFPRLAAEFPDFDVSTLPFIPSGFEDESWRNEACPCFFSAELGLRLWVDYPQAADREFPELGRFILHRPTFNAAGVETGERETVAESDDWGDVAAVIMGEEFARLLKDDLSPKEWREMRRRNASPDYNKPGVKTCASHDFCDANMAMAPAFEAVMGRPFALGVDDTEQQADFVLWGKAWDHARAAHLTAGNPAQKQEA